MEANKKKDYLITIVKSYADNIEQHLSAFESRIKSFVGDIIMQSKDIEEKGYCGTFHINYKDIISFFEKETGLKKEQLSRIGLLLHGVPEGKLTIKKTGKSKNADSTMYADAYYAGALLTLTALLELYKRHTDPSFRKKIINLIYLTMFFVLTKLWNGRRVKYFPKGCDPNIMNYVIQNEIRSGALVKAYDNPKLMLINYFIPTLYKKYIESCFMKHLNSADMFECVSKLFKQGWARLDQIFATSERQGKRFGLANKYYDVKKSGKYSVQKQTQDAEINYMTINSEHELIQDLSEKIKHFIMFSNIEDIPIDLFNFIYKRTKIKKELIKRLPQEIKRPDIEVEVSDVLSLLIRKFNLHINKNTVCSPQFYIWIDKIISSKNNPVVNEYKDVLKEIARRLVPDFDEKSSVTQTALLRAINFVLAYYIQKYICEHEKENI